MATSRRGAARARCPRRVGSALALGAVALLVLLPGWNPDVAAPASAPQPSATMLSRTALLSAEQSLARGAGPAEGTAATCLPSAGESASCASAAARSHPALASVPEWTDLGAMQTASMTVRSLGSMVWDGHDGYVLLFGGCATPSTCNGVELGETWIFTHDRWVNLTGRLSSAPSARAIAGIAYDAADKEVVLFGGLIGLSSGTSYSVNDTWAFSNGSWRNISANSTLAPAPRYRDAMTYDASDGYVLLYGGSPSSAALTPFKDTWKFLHGNWTNITASVTGNPGGRLRASMVYDAADGYVLLFGGCLSSTICPLGTTWKYLNGTWTNLTASLTSAPSARVYPTMTYDSVDGYVLLVGGTHTTVAGPVYGDTWKFANGSWTNLSSKLTTSPTKRGESMLASDPADNLTLLFGGYDLATGYNDSWAWGPAIYVLASATNLALDQGESTTIQVRAAADATPLSYNFTGLPSGCASKDVANLSCTPSVYGTFDVNASVNDSLADRASANLTLRVQPDPVVTSFSVSPGTNVTSGTPVQFGVGAALGTPGYHYVYRGLPAGCASASVYNLSCRPTVPGNASLNFTIEVVVVDATGFPAFANLSLQVNPRPGTPLFSATRATLDVGETTIFRINAVGGTAPYSYDYSGLPTGCASQNSSILSCTPTGAARLYAVTGAVTDRFGWSNNSTLDIQVDPALSIVTATSSLRTADAGDSVTVWFNVTGGTAPLVYSFVGLPTGCVFGGLSTGSCAFPLASNYSINASVVDATGAGANATIPLSVVADPQILTFIAAPNVTDIGVPTSLNLTVVGGVAPFAYDWARLPPGCAPASSPGLLCTPNAPGRYPVVATVTDALKKSSSFTAIVLVNVRPAVTAFNVTPENLTVGDRLYLGASATGGTGALRYSYTGLPTGCASPGNSTFNCTVSGIGTFNLTLHVTDAVNVSAEANASVTVKARPPPPSGSIVPEIGGSTTNTYLLITLGVILVILLVLVVAIVPRRRRAAPQRSAAGAAPASVAAAPEPEEPLYGSGPPPSPPPSPAAWDESVPGDSPGSGDR